MAKRKSNKNNSRREFIGLDNLTIEDGELRTYKDNFKRADRRNKANRNLHRYSDPINDAIKYVERNNG